MKFRRARNFASLRPHPLLSVNTNPESSAAANAPDAEIATRRARVQRGAQRAQRAVMTILVLTCLLGVAMVAASYRAYQSQRRAEQAEAQSAERSWHAFLAQARAERLSAQAGHRAIALAALSNAAAIRPSVELRDEALYRLKWIAVGGRNGTQFPVTKLQP